MQSTSRIWEVSSSKLIEIQMSDGCPNTTLFYPNEVFCAPQLLTAACSDGQEEVKWKSAPSAQLIPGHCTKIVQRRFAQKNYTSAWGWSLFRVDKRVPRIWFIGGDQASEGALATAAGSRILSAKRSSANCLAAWSRGLGWAAAPLLRASCNSFRQRSSGFQSRKLEV